MGTSAGFILNLRVENPHGVFFWAGDGVADADGEGEAEDGPGVGLTEAAGEPPGAVPGPGCVPGGAGGGFMAAAG